MSDPLAETGLAPIGSLDAEGRESGAVPETSPLAKVHSLLRGRYVVALVLGGTLGVAGGTAGMLLPAVTYTSRGAIEVQPNIPRILYRTDENGMLPMFDAYVASQANLLRSRRVLDRAFESDAWRAVAGASTDGSRSSFLRGVRVDAPPRSTVIEVSYTDGNATVAMTGVEQVIRAYEAEVAEREGTSDVSTRRVLETQRTLNANKLQDIRTEILQKSLGLGPEAIEARYQFLVAQVNEFDRLLAEIDVELSAGGSEPEDAAAGEPTPQEIAVTDARMDALLLEKVRLESEIHALKAWAGSNRKELVDAENALAATNRHIEERRAAVVATQGNLPDGGHLTRRGREQHRARISTMRDAQDAEVRRLSGIRSELANLETDKTIIEERLQEVKRRIDQISVESEVQNRIQVISYGDMPLEPDKDKRRVLALVGGMGGLGLGFGLVALYGLLGARMRHLDDVDVRARRGRFVGILPQVSASAEAETAGMADFCVHHVRAMLQLRRGDARRVVGITSASPGAGKSTVAMALGVSFSGTGARTLLVDCDVVGHGLTALQRSLVAAMLERSVTAGPESAEAVATRAPRLTDVVGVRTTQVSGEDLARLVATARSRAAGEDERLTPWLRAAEQLLAHEGAPDGVRRAAPGVLDAMDGRPLEECVRESGVRGLSILPTGGARERDVARFSMESVSRLLAECSARYDVVIVDAGPVVMSIEASFALARADDVVFVVPRGESQGMVADALSRLDAIGANVSGIVFNRASVEDVMRSSYSARSSRPADAVHAS